MYIVHCTLYTVQLVTIKLWKRKTHKPSCVHLMLSFGATVIAFSQIQLNRIRNWRLKLYISYTLN